MNTTVKLAIAAGIVAGVTGYMAYVGSTTSWKYYLTVDECLADAPALVQQRMRVSGKVAVGTLDVSADRTQATFELCGTDRQLPVTCIGPLPDNLAEDMEVVVEGHLDQSGLLQGDQLLTRCASKYAPAAKTASAVGSPTSAEELRR